MPVRKADAVWEGTLHEGKGSMKFGSGAFDGAYTHKSRFAEETGTNPEELIGAAHAGCYSMDFAGRLGRAGFTPEQVSTTAQVHINKGDAGFAIDKIELFTEARVAGIDEAAFQEIAIQTKNGCPVSKALSSVPIEVTAKLIS